MHHQDGDGVGVRCWLPVQAFGVHAAHFLAQVVMHHLELLRDLGHDGFHADPSLARVIRVSDVHRVHFTVTTGQCADAGAPSLRRCPMSSYRGLLAARIQETLLVCTCC